MFRHNKNLSNFKKLPAGRTIYIFTNAAIIGSRADKRKLISSPCESLVNVGPVLLTQRTG
ncbi:hypothetical protein AGR1A_Lc80584 [Agrobacterium fabacearum CFBP 5771]|nr:hypothetical protein AGR1A_Lc80584 [Agrobacterium fabacearum CFBP 5771]